MEPVKIDEDEWWYKGCFIQKQYHPKLSKYIVFKDTDYQEHVGVTYNFMEAKLLCISNEVKDYKYGAKAFL